MLDGREDKHSDRRVTVSEAYDVVVVSNKLCAVIWEPWSSAHTRERTVAAGEKNLSTQRKRVEEEVKRRRQ